MALTDPVTSYTTNYVSAPISGNAADIMAGIPGIPTGASTSSNTAPSPGQHNVAIPQDERLFTARPRSISFHNTVEAGGDRGSRAYIRLLTTKASDPFTRQADPGQGQSKSLGTADKGVLKNLVSGNAIKENGYSDGYASFLVSNVSCSMSEKMQVTQVFGDAEVVYYFGRNPVTFNISGMLIDSPDNNWFVEWLELYALHMRGSQLARNYELLKIVLPNMVITGTISSFNWQQDSSNDVQVPFSFQFLAKQIEPTAAILDLSNIISSTGTINFGASDPVSLSKRSQNAVIAFAGAQDLATAMSSPLTTLSTLGNLFNSGSGTPSGVSKFIDGLTSSVNGVTKGLTGTGSIFGGVSSALTGIRASLFSPVFGVLSSLTKLISSVTGGLQSVIGSFTTPIQGILRDITSISNQAAGLVSMLAGGINGAAGMISGTINSAQSAINSLSHTMGVISTSPKTVGDALRNLVNSGSLPANARFLNSVPLSARLSPAFLALNGGTRNSPAAVLFASLSAGHNNNNKLALLNSGPVHTPQKGANI